MMTKILVLSKKSLLPTPPPLENSLITMLFLIISILSAFTEFNHFEEGIEQNCNKLNQIIQSIKDLDKSQGNTVCPASPDLDLVPTFGEWQTCDSKLHGGGSKQKDFDKVFNIYRHLNIWIKTRVHDAIADLNCQCGTRFTWQLHGISKTFDHLLQSYTNHTNKENAHQSETEELIQKIQDLDNDDTIPDLVKAEFKGDRAKPAIKKSCSSSSCMRLNLPQDPNLFTFGLIFTMFLLIFIPPVILPS